MASLNLDLNYFDHLKTLRLMARLGETADVLPLRLWAYVGKHHPESGCLPMLEAELEQVCRWRGEKGAMVTAMVEVGFIERKDERLFVVHDWFDHSGHLGAYKKRAKKAAQKRWGMLQASPSITKNEPSNASSITKQCPDVTVLDVPKRSNTIPQTPTSLPSATPPTPRNGTAPAAPKIAGLEPAGGIISTLKINGKLVMPEPEIPDDERMSLEEMETIRRANMRPDLAKAKAAGTLIDAEVVSGGPDDVF